MYNWKVINKNRSKTKEEYKLKTTPMNITRKLRQRRKERCGERAVSDLVDYLRLVGYITVPTDLLVDFNLLKTNQYELGKYLLKNFNIKLKNHPAE